ncbi:MAG: long-chain fatty acid--CoA ligase [Deferrisomatales bacterium]|nr:long-chain fatty acid--CoA ligase [Deferrisomatales bacterium]
MVDHPWFACYDDHVPARLEYPATDLYTQFAAAAERFAALPALKFLGLTLTYRQLSEHIERLAAALHARGLLRGDRVVLLLPNCPQFVIAYYALQRLGAVAVLANPLNVERELLFKFRDSAAKGVILLDLLSRKLNAIRGELDLEFVIYSGIGEFLPFPKNLLYPVVRRLDKKLPAVHIPGDARTLRLKNLLAESHPAPPSPAIEPEDTAALLYSGGTTGIAKGIMLSHRALVSNLTQVCAWVALDEADSLLAVLPLFHGFGMSVCMNAPLCRGASVVLLPKFDPAQVVATIEKDRPTLFAGVPTMFIALKTLPDLGQRTLTSLRGIFAGAAPLPLEVMREFERLTGAHLIEGYGLTEAVTAIACNPARGVRKPGTVGIPFPDVEWRLVDLLDGTGEVPAGEAGEVVLRGPDLMTGYWNQPEKTAEVLRDGWLHTGDVGVLDADGYLTIVDRIKDLVIVGGFNVFPSEIDAVLHQHPKVLEGVAVGLPHPTQGEFIKAYVVPRPGQILTGDEVIAFCRENLSLYMVPREVEVRADLPKSAIGKVLRRQLREEALGAS